MYFDPQAKQKSEDFFNFEVLQQELKKVLADPHIPLIAIHGLRRTGKTSLIRVVLNSLKKKYVWVDGREIASRNEFFMKLSEEVSQRRRFEIKGISFKGVSWSFDLYKKDLDYLNRKKITLVIDEVQLLKKMKIDYFLASLFDNYPQIKMVVSGSEKGMLMHFLGQANAKAPLYGRAVFELSTRRLTKEEGLHFLREGAKKLDPPIKEEEILDAIQHLDGIIGWLTKYGWYRLRLPHKPSLNKTMEEGSHVAYEEFLRFAARSEKKYLRILKAMKEGARWEEIKRQTQTSDAQLGIMLRRMIDYGFVEKEEQLYRISDPLLEVAI